MVNPVTWASVAATAVTTGTLWWIAMGHAAEPVVPAGDTKTLYRDLRRPIPTAAAAAVGAAVAITALTRAPAPTWPLWAVVATIGAVLTVVDAYTTWMPKRVAHLGWLADMAAVVGLLAFGHRTTAIAAALGVVTTAAAFLLAWRLSRRAFGFGDVRYLPILGAATMATSPHTYLAALLAGTLLLAVHGVLDRAISRRVRVFPWAPALLAGATVAMWLP